MIDVGIIKQYRGPFEPNQEIDLQGNCKIGISISEDDLMSWKAHKEENTWVGQDFVFIINEQIIHMGRTCMYETDNQINNVKISFPDGAPLSLIIDAVYCDEN